MEQEVYDQVKSSVKRMLNIDLTYYKDEQMKRRLDSWLTRMAAASWQDYFQMISKNPIELSRFRDYLTINVTEFFRDLERWQMLRQTLLPVMLKETAGQAEPFRVWSAGCSIGVEAYTLAMLMEESAPGRAVSILATDLDKGALQKARARGPFRPDEVRNLTPEQRLRYMDVNNGLFYVKNCLTRSIRFEEHDLNADRFGTRYDLIVCRNVIIYFTSEAKQNLYMKFHGALRPGGLLFLGGTEIIPSAKEMGFRNQGYSFYIKEKQTNECKVSKPIY